MNWTHVLAFGLGSLWMLLVFLLANAMRSPLSRIGAMDEEGSDRLRARDGSFPQALPNQHSERGVRSTE